MYGSREHSQTASLRDPSLDGLRGAAVLLVFLFHYGGGLRAHQPLLRMLGYATQQGWVGVELFFVLSGFLITALLLNILEQRTPMSSFFVRRAFRILPLYVVALATAVTAALISGATPHQLRPFLVYVSFLQNTPPFQQLALQTPPPLPLYHLWSLAVEEQFYILWPLCVLLVPRPHRLLIVCLCIFALSGLCRGAMASGPDGGYRVLAFAALLPVRAGGFALGGALTCVQRLRSRKAPLKLSIPLTMIGLAIFLLTGHLTHSYQLSTKAGFVFLPAAADLFATGLVGLAVTGPITRRALSFAPLSFLGRISYGVYVLHILMQPVFDRLGCDLTHSTSGFLYQAARLCTAFPLTLVAAWLSFSVMEQPLSRLGNHFSQQAPPVSFDRGRLL